MMQLEVCANSYQSAINAQKAGTHRIELCQQLEVGGISPSVEVFKKVRKALNIPIHVLIRPRAGNFVYSEEEFEEMLAQIEEFKSLGADGIVCGSLNANKTVNVIQTKELIELSKPLSFTFHRAFDEVNQPFIALELLESLDVDRILTSGQQASAVAGIELLKKLKKASKTTVILPAAGINHNNASLFVSNKFTEIHASCSVKNPIENTEIKTISGLDEISLLLNTINS